VKKPKYHRPSTIEKHELIVKLYKEGKTTEQIAEIMKIHLRSVQRALAYADIPLVVGKPKKLLDEEMPKIYNLLRRRESSYDALASEYGVTVNTMRKRVRDYEFELKRRFANGTEDPRQTG
jgi:transposase